MKIRRYIKISLVGSGFLFLLLFVLGYFSIVFVSQFFGESWYYVYVTYIGVPVMIVSFLGGVIVSYVYFFKYRSFLNMYYEEYDSFISKLFVDTDIRKFSVIESIFRGVDKDESGVYKVLPHSDEFGDFGRVINLLLSNLYQQDVEKSRLLSYQKEVINKLLNFIDEPIVILRKAHSKKGSIIVGNLNRSFLSAIKPENVVRLATKLFDRLKVKQVQDRYLYDLVIEIIRSEGNEDKGIDEIFVGQEIGIEEFLVEIDWFFYPVDERSQRIISFMKDLIKGSDFVEMDSELVLDVLGYEEYRKSYSLPDSASESDFITLIAPDDEITFIKKRQDIFYRDGIEIRNFRFVLGSSQKTKVENEHIFDSDFVLIPATSRSFSPEKMLIIMFRKISIVH